MSLAPKITEVAEFAMRKDVDLACITIAWSRLLVSGNNWKAGMARTGSGRERGHAFPCPLSLPDPVRATPAFRLFPLTESLEQASITERWLKERIADSEEIPIYSINRLDRQVVERGGVCLNVKDLIKIKSSNVARNMKYCGSILGLRDAPRVLLLS